MSTTDSTNPSFFASARKAFVAGFAGAVTALAASIPSSGFQFDVPHLIGDASALVGGFIVAFAATWATTNDLGALPATVTVTPTGTSTTTK